MGRRNRGEGVRLDCDPETGWPPAQAFHCIQTFNKKRSVEPARKRHNKRFNERIYRAMFNQGAIYREAITAYHTKWDIDQMAPLILEM
jgi:hypothetical protein